MVREWVRGVWMCLELPQPQACSDIGHSGHRRRGHGTRDTAHRTSGRHCILFSAHAKIHRNMQLGTTWGQEGIATTMTTTWNSLKIPKFVLPKICSNSRKSWGIETKERGGWNSCRAKNECVMTGKKKYRFFLCPLRTQFKVKFPLCCVRKWYLSQKCAI